MADPYGAQLKVLEKLLPLIDSCLHPETGAGLSCDREDLAILIVQNQEMIVKALRRPPAMAGPAEVETVEKIVYHHFYPGPLSGSTTRLARALIDAYPALQGHEG
jgi:hypothetical protein